MIELSKEQLEEAEREEQEMKAQDSVEHEIKVSNEGY